MSGWNHKFDALLKRFFQDERLPLWTRQALWFIDTLVAFDWRYARNRAAAFVEERLKE